MSRDYADVPPTSRSTACAVKYATKAAAPPMPLTSRPDRHQMPAPKVDLTVPRAKRVHPVMITERKKLETSLAAKVGESLRRSRRDHAEIYRR